MSVTPESQPVDRFEFYAAQYSRFESEAAAEIRREVYGEDLGQQGWRSFDEQTIIANLIRESSPCHVLDIACGSGGPSLSLVNQTGCRLTGWISKLQASSAPAAKRWHRAFLIRPGSKLRIAVRASPIPTGRSMSSFVSMRSFISKTASQRSATGRDCFDRKAAFSSLMPPSSRARYPLKNSISEPRKVRSYSCHLD